MIRRRVFQAPSTQSSQSSGRCSHCDDEKGGSHPSAKANIVEPKADELQERNVVTSPLKLKVQNQKINNKVEQGTASKGPFVGNMP